MPPVGGLQVGAARRVQRVDDAVGFLPGFAAHQQQRLAVAVVDEAVADSCAGWKRGQVASDHPVQVSIDPGVDFSFEHVDELFFVLFGVGP